jgi:probable F420-dependent oxidoreductase
MSRPRCTLSLPLPSFAAEPPDDWSHLFGVARAADEAGIDRLVVSDHVVFGENMEAYGRPEVGGMAGGRQPTGPDGQWLEPLTTLAMVGAQTSRVRLSTGILLAALRRPAVLAKTLATLDVLTGGRVDLGVGVGWQREEYEAAGLDFAGRGRLLDLSLEVCQTLWTETAASLHNEIIDADGIHAMPKPLQAGGVPIWVSGTVNPRVLQRIVRFGSGWIPWGADMRDPAGSIAVVHRALADAGRDPTELAVTTWLPLKKTDGDIDVDTTMDATVPLVEAGITDFRLGVAVPSDHQAALDQLGAMVDAFAARTAT